MNLFFSCKKMRAKPPARQHGFTLVEILVVLVIIGILATIAIPAYNSSVDRAKITVAKATLDMIKKSLEVTRIDHSAYPLTIDFTTGLDGNGHIVLSPELCAHIQKDLFAVDSYLPVSDSYTLSARAMDSNHTSLTLTPENIRIGP